MPLSYKHCCVKNCQNSNTTGDVKYFMFPRNAEIGKKWLETMQNPLAGTNLNYEDLRRRFSICELHFELHHFQTPARAKLNRNAVPVFCSVNIEGPTVEQPELSKPGPSSSDDQHLGECGHMESANEDSPVVSLRSLLRRNQEMTPRKSLLRRELWKCKKHLSNIKWKYSKARTSLFNGKQSRKDVLSLMNDRHFLELNNISEAGAKFILSQLKQSKKAKNARKWTTEEKALYIALYRSGPRAYRFMQKLFVLPSTRTLRRTLNTIPISVGIHYKVLKHMAVHKFKKDTERYCSLMFDEISIQPHLDSQLTCQGLGVVGLENLGKGRTKNIADKALVFMLRGINSSWKQPIAFYFAKSGVKTFRLAEIIQDVVTAVHSITNYRILASICDQGSANIAAIKYLSLKCGKNSNDFIYEVDKHVIFHLFDPPHLLKCMRNNFMMKNIHFEGGVARWEDIQQLYLQDSLTTHGKVLYRITENHINPEGSAKMKVRLAAQIFSKQVYAALMLVHNCSNMFNWKATAAFITFMDDLFDSVNSRRVSYKPLRKALTDKSGHFEFWLQAKKRLLDLKFFKDGRPVSSPPSVNNFVVTIRNIQGLWDQMKKLGFKYLATGTLNQDSLENLFGVVRSLCGQNPRPTTVQFLAAYKTCLINSVMLVPNTANCIDDATHNLLNLINASSSSSSQPTATDSPPASSSATSSDVLALPLVVSANTIPKEILHLRQNTSAYIAGFICRRVLTHNCPACVSSMITETKNESHVLISLRDVGGKLKYPSSSMIRQIDFAKQRIFEIIPNIINKNNLLTLDFGINFDFVTCSEHQDEMHREILKSVIIIMVKHFVTIANRKLNKKYLHRNKVVDEYLHLHGPKYILK